MLQSILGSRRGLTRSDQFYPLFVLLATVLLVAGSTAYSAYSARTNRQLQTRALNDFATLAAWNFAYRAHGLFSGMAFSIVSAAGDIPLDARGPDTKHLAHLADSLAQCDCEYAIRPLGFATGRWHDSLSVRYNAVSGHSPADLHAIDSTLAQFTSTPLPGERVGVFTGGNGSTSWLLLVVPIGGIGQDKEGFLAIDLDVSYLATQGFSRVFNGRSWSMFLPTEMVSVATNRELGQLVVATKTAELYRSVPAANSGYRGTVPLASNGALTATLELSESAARALVRGTLPSPNPTAEIVMPLLVILLSCAVVLALYRAHGLAQGRAEFAASVTHELRTPLTNILLSAETLALERAANPKDRTRMLDSIVRESRRLVYLIENVLHFSRADRRMLRLAPRPTRVDLLVAEHLDDLQPLIDSANAQIVVADSDALTAYADPDGLKLVLTNVLDNAMHYASGRPVHITCEGNARHVYITVDDQGPGIVADDRKRAMRPFARLRDAERMHPTGSGIGLAVVRELMRGMSGDVALSASPHAGLRVQLTLQTMSPTSALVLP